MKSKLFNNIISVITIVTFGASVMLGAPIDTCGLGIQAQAAAMDLNVMEVSTEEEFNAALEDAGIDVIQLTNEITLSRSADGKDNAFVINRPVTITGGGLRLERAGIVLGADVTLENMTLYFATAVRNAIIANGYSLTINNVTNTNKNTYTIDLFCGGITDYNGGNEVPAAGSHGRIIMQGNNSIGGNIYAGSLSDVGDGVADSPNTYSGNVTITLEQNEGELCNVYAHGAKENRSGGHANEWIADATKYTVIGDVSICLSTCMNITVDGQTGGDQNATFVYKDNGMGYKCCPTLNNVDSIELIPSDNDTLAHLEPITVQTDFNTLSVPYNTRLSFVNMGNAISASSLMGGGTIVFSGAEQKLTLDTASDDETEVAVGGVDFSGTSSTKAIEEEWTCITITDDFSDAGFWLLPNSINMLLEDEGNGNWTTRLAECLTCIQEISIDSTIEDLEDNNGINIPMSVLYGSEEEYNYLADVPITITVNGEEAIRTVGVMGYEYSTGNTSSDIFMQFGYGDYDEEILQIINYDFDIYSVPAGIYNISITIPGENMEDGQDKTITTVLTVVSAVEANIGARLAGYTLSLNGNIGLNFHMKLEDAVVENEQAKMVFTHANGTVEEIAVSSVRPTDKDGISYYIFSCDVAAKEMTDEVQAQIVIGDQKGAVYTYSVKEYADYVLKHPEEYREVIPLVKAMLNYGAYSQTYFNYNTGELANAGLGDDATLSDVAVENLEAYKAVKNANEKVCTFNSAYLSLNSETKVAVKVKLADGVSNAEFYIGENQVECSQSGDYYVLSVDNVKAHLLDDMYDFKVVANVNGSQEQATLRYGALSYCRTALNGDYDLKLQNVVKALCLYNVAADEYFGVQSYGR